MGPECYWTIQVRAYITTINGRVCYAVVHEDGLIHAAVLPVGENNGDASLDIIQLLRNHPDLARMPIDFGTTHAPLRDALAADVSLAGANVEVLAASRISRHEPMLLEAQAAVATEVASIPLYAATDGARDKAAKRRGQDASARPIRAGYGWVTENGLSGYDSIRATTPLQAELVAISKLLDGTDPRQPLVVFVDSTAALKLARVALIDGADYPTEPTKATRAPLDAIRAHAGRQVSLYHVKGHNDTSQARASMLNTCADGLAQLGRRGMDLHGDAGMVDEFATQAVAKVQTRLAS